MLGWPKSPSFTVKALAAGAPAYPGEIGAISLLGSSEPFVTKRDAGGLTLALPTQMPAAGVDAGYAFKIVSK